ncbi:uncharacterized protein LOC118372429 isoform X3 [Oncorhynchus keta]|nr:uncharacterized protein LOC118372429 isoform X3 [Oncorhynchus keta]
MGIALDPAYIGPKSRVNAGIQFSSATVRESDLQKALGVVLDLLDLSSWRRNLDVWNHLMTIVKRLRPRKQWLKIVAEELVNRMDWWLAMHFTTFQARRDLAVNGVLLEVKCFVLGAFCPRYAFMYCVVGKDTQKEVTSEAQKTKRSEKDKESKTAKAQKRMRKAKLTLRKHLGMLLGASARTETFQKYVKTFYHYLIMANNLLMRSLGHTLSPSMTAAPTTPPHCRPHSPCIASLLKFYDCPPGRAHTMAKF